MLGPLPIFSQSDYLIQIIDINSHTLWQIVQIQISWFLQKPTDLDLHCLQRQGISGFSRTRVKFLLFGIWIYSKWLKVLTVKIIKHPKSTILSLTLVLLNPAFANSVDPDLLASPDQLASVSIFFVSVLSFTCSLVLLYLSLSPSLLALLSLP